MAARRSLEGKVVIVTGSSRGIGYKTAEHFLSRGAKVVINGRNAERLEKAKDKLDHEDVLAVAGNMTIDEDAARLIAAAKETFGRIDALVLNAGLMMRGRFADLKADVVTSIINTNIVGVALPIIQAIPELTSTGGSIEIISSLAGIRGMPHINLYCASKMALTAIAQSLWVELAGSGVHVGILYVGITENDPDKELLAAAGGTVKVSPKYHSTQEDVARTIYKQITRRKKKIVMTPAGKALATVQWLMPGVLTFLISKAQGISAKFAK